MKILVTGGAGFIGSHVAQAHVDRGDDVVVIDNLSMGRIENVPKGARFIEMDITSDQVLPLFQRENFDVVNHHAAHMELRVSVDKPAHDASVNVIGSVNIFEAARATAVRHCIVASTVAVFGDLEYVPADELHPICPIAPYGVSKRSMELYADYYRKTHGMCVTVLRYTNVYGPRQNPHGESGVIAIFLNRALEGRMATIHGDGLQERDYLYASDVAEANVQAAIHQLNDTFIVCANTKTSVNEVVQALNDALESPIQIEHGPAKPGDPLKVRALHDRFTAATGWLPTVEVGVGILHTVKAFKKS